MPFLISLPLPRPKLPDDSEPESFASPWRPVLLWGGLLLVVLLIFLLRALTAERRAIANMEPQARAALYKETWRGFQALCQQQADPALASRCHEQADFLLKFPECDEACHQQLASFMQPSR